MSRAFLFDVGNVLVHFNFAPAVRRLADASGISGEQIHSLLAPLKIEHESGRMNDDVFVGQASAAIGFTGPPESFVEIWSDIFTENAPMAALVKELADRHPLYLFSNTSGLHKNWFTSHFDVFSRFRGGVYSHEVRHMKPDEAFYHAAIRQFGLDPAETFYVDDLSENIAVGRRLGFATHLYDAERHEALEEEVERWLSGG